MSQEAVERVLGRLLTDDLFRAKAGKSLNRVCWEEGLSLSEEELHLVGELDLKELDRVSEMLNGGIKRFVVRQEPLPGSGQLQPHTFT